MNATPLPPELRDGLSTALGRIELYAAAARACVEAPTRPAGELARHLQALSTAHDRLYELLAGPGTDGLFAPPDQVQP